MPRPRRALDASARRLDCARTGQCLRLADHAGWPSFACSPECYEAPGVEQQESDVIALLVLRHVCERAGASAPTVRA